MKFKDLDSRMRVFETNQDQIVLPGMYIIARIDGRGFTKLTKHCKFEKPYDIHFREYMIETVMHLMNSCGFNIVYGYTQSDEISLLCDLNIDVFGRKIRKYISVLAGEASSKFTLLLNDLAVFDCRISTIPNAEGVIDYFRWRMQDATRNCINSYCYYKILNEGKTPRAAAKELNKKSVSWKNEFLFERGTNFDKLPSWQKRGIGINRERYCKIGYNPKTKESSIVYRKRICVNEELPMGERYASFIEKYILTTGFTISPRK